MDLIDYFRRQFAYDRWANHEIIAALRAEGASSPRSIQLLAHILSAERIWFERLTNRPQSLPVWPSLDLTQCEVHVVELATLWLEYLDKSSAAALAMTISYKNSKGEAWESSVQDVLTHVIMHSAYHRGQIATEMRGRGYTPAYTDFIQAARAGLIG